MINMCWKQNTCPLCERTFRVTPRDDILIPSCGCFDNAAEGTFPCHECGLRHIYEHEGITVPPRQVAVFVDGEHVIASAEAGPDADALLGEFFVDPSEST